MGLSAVAQPWLDRRLPNPGYRAGGFALALMSLVLSGLRLADGDEVSAVLLLLLSIGWALLVTYQKRPSDRR